MLLKVTRQRREIAEREGNGKMKKYLNILVDDDSIVTLKDLFDYYKIKNISQSDFLEYNPDGTLKNKERIFNSYSNQQKYSFAISSSNQMSETNCKIVSPVLLFLPVDHIEEKIKKESNFVNHKDYNAFLSDEMLNIVENPEFRTSEFLKTFPRIHVWLWCKALSKSDERIEGGLIDITPFVNNLTTHVGDTGGNFSISLDEMICEWNYSLNHWDVKSNSLRGSDTSNIVSKGLVFNPSQQSAFISVNDKAPAKIGQSNGVINRRNSFFLNTVVSSNDIVFISFDRLSFNEETTKANFDGPYRVNLNKQDIPNNVFDMIGLVDVCDKSYQAGSVDVSISISGRDLMKLLIDDGTFWFYNSYSNPNDGGVFNNISDSKTGDGVNARTEEGTVPDERVTNRMFATAWIEAFAIPDPKKIIDVLEIMIATLSNIRVCDDDLFSSYGDRRTKYRTLK